MQNHIISFQTAKIVSPITLPEQKRKHSITLITASQRQRTIMQSHDLTRKTQSDASTFLLSREEWNEDLILALTAYRKTVV